MGSEVPVMGAVTRKSRGSSLPGILRSIELMERAAVVGTATGRCFATLMRLFMML